MKCEGGYKPEWGDWKLLETINSSVKNCVTFRIYETQSKQIMILSMYEGLISQLITPYKFIHKYGTFLSKYNISKKLLERIKLQAVAETI